MSSGQVLSSLRGFHNLGANKSGSNITHSSKSRHVTVQWYKLIVIWHHRFQLTKQETSSYYDVPVSALMQSNVPLVGRCICHNDVLGTLLLTWFNLSSSMDKQSNVQWSVGWHYITIPKICTIGVWELISNFIQHGCNYLSLVGVSKIRLLPRAILLHKVIDFIPFIATEPNIDLNFFFNFDKMKSTGSPGSQNLD